MTLRQNLEIRAYRGHLEDGPGIVSVWNDAMGVSYPMDERLWRQNVDEDPHHDASGVLLAEAGGKPVGFVVARVCRVPLGSEGMREGEGWINSLVVSPQWQRKGVGVSLLRRAELWLKAHGARAVRAGGDPGHFLPGIPSTHASGLAFFSAMGYEPVGDPCFDVIRDIRAFEAPAEVGRTLATRVAFRSHECTNRSLPALMEFLGSTFPGRWLYETQLRLEAERNPQVVSIMTLGSRVVGFAHTYGPASRRLGPSVYWRKALGTSPGGLGPIGLAEDVRGQGLGLALLCHCAEQLRRSGVERMAVDWVGNLALYTRAGFRRWKEYHAYGRSL